MHFIRNMSARTVRALSIIMMLAFLPVTSLQAAMVGTESVIQTEQAKFDRDQILSKIQQQEAQEALATLGVDSKEIEDRVANMTAEELTEFNAELNELPAGGVGIFGAIVFILLLLIVLDLLGTADIFPAIKPIRY